MVWSLKGELMKEPVRVVISPSCSARRPRDRCLLVATLTLSALHLVAVGVRWPRVFWDSRPPGMLVSKSGWRILRDWVSALVKRN